VAAKRLPKTIVRRALKALERRRYVRKTRLYCVGTAKSGTHSIAAMFDDAVRCGHELDNIDVIRQILAVSEGKVSESEMMAYIRSRDKRLCLDVDSSQLNFFLLDYLLSQFSDAVFLLTIRDCYSWLDSFINDSLCHSATGDWVKFREYRFNTHMYLHPEEERPLKERGLYTLDGYLSYWTYHNKKVLSSISNERLMVIRTSEITKMAREIAMFAGLMARSVRVEKSHAYRNPIKLNVLGEVDKVHLEAKVEQHCRELMSIFFPEIRSYSDVRI